MGEYIVECRLIQPLYHRIGHSLVVNNTMQAPQVAYERFLFNKTEYSICFIKRKVYRQDYCLAALQHRTDSSIVLLTIKIYEVATNGVEKMGVNHSMSAIVCLRLAFVDIVYPVYDLGST